MTGWRKSKGRYLERHPGTLVYFGGAVHEVLGDGISMRVRHDLVPGSPARLWKAKWSRNRFGLKKTKRTARKWKRRPPTIKKRRDPKRWIQNAFKYHKKGTLHRMLGVPLDQKIPLAKLKWAVRQPNRLLRQRAQLVLNVRGLGRR